jgi:hypothetical protein
MGNDRSTRYRAQNDLRSQVARLAQRQGGHITRVQALQLGFTRDAIAHKLATGEWLLVHRGVYAVGHLPTTHVDRGRGALLACGSRSALGFGAAGAYWGLYRRWIYPLEVIVASDHRPPTVRTHHSETLVRTDVWTPEENLRVTSPARTVLDNTPRLSDDVLKWQVSNLRVRRLVTIEQLSAVAARNHTHPGRKRLEALVGASPKEPFRSPFEVEWPPFAKLHADRAEVNELLAELGIPSLRITYDQFHLSPERCAGWVPKTLARRP